MLIRRIRHFLLGSMVAAHALSGPAARAGEPAPYDFATVTAPGGVANPPVPASIVPPGVKFPGPAVGRGSVAYDYRIAKTELSSGEWVTFLNTFSPVAQPHPYWNTVNTLGASYWGGTEIFNHPDPQPRFRLINYPNAANLPVIGIPWYMAAMYCNWLHNGRSSDPASLIRGAYDTTTWGTNQDGSFSDALTHETGARYWIPTLDEWLKAGYYDPNDHGQGDDGWWLYANSKDRPPIPGAPGVGETAVGWNQAPGSNMVGYLVPLGAYPDQTSPWGLLDISGGAGEYVEEATPWARYWLGSYPVRQQNPDPNDIFNSLLRVGGDHPNGAGFAGLRLASAVPSSGAATLLLIVGGCIFQRRTRGESR